MGYWNAHGCSRGGRGGGQNGPKHAHVINLNSKTSYPKFTGWKNQILQNATTLIKQFLSFADFVLLQVNNYVELYNWKEKMIAQIEVIPNSCVKSVEKL